MLVVLSHVFATSWHLVINVCKWNKTYTAGIKHPPVYEVLASTETTARGNNLKCTLSAKELKGYFNLKDELRLKDKITSYWAFPSGNHRAGPNAA